jgi:anti-anti-sigma factor
VSPADRRCLQGLHFLSYGASLSTLEGVEPAAGTVTMSLIQSKMHDGLLSIKIVGRFTFQVFREFSAAYQGFEEQPKQVEVDLKGVEYIDSAALGMLLSMHSHFDDGAEIRLANPNETVRKILEIARFDKTFEII